MCRYCKERKREQKERRRCGCGSSRKPEKNKREEKCAHKRDSHCECHNHHRKVVVDGDLIVKRDAYIRGKTTTSGVDADFVNVGAGGVQSSGPVVGSRVHMTEGASVIVSPSPLARVPTTFVMPPTNGAPNSSLKTDGAGNTFWSSGPLLIHGPQGQGSITVPKFDVPGMYNGTILVSAGGGGGGGGAAGEGGGAGGNGGEIYKRSYTVNEAGVLVISWDSLGGGGKGGAGGNGKTGFAGQTGGVGGDVVNLRVGSDAPRSLKGGAGGGGGDNPDIGGGSVPIVLPAIQGGGGGGGSYNGEPGGNPGGKPGGTTGGGDGGPSAYQSGGAGAPTFGNPTFIYYGGGGGGSGGGINGGAGGWAGGGEAGGVTGDTAGYGGGGGGGGGGVLIFSADGTETLPGGAGGDGGVAYIMISPYTAGN